MGQGGVIFPWMSLHPPAPIARSRIRRWFRSRLDREPRRWVLFLAALEGLVSGAGAMTDRAGPAKLEAVWTVVRAVGLTLAPLGALVLLVVHCRLLYWSGKALGGRARPFELHAATSWAALPVVLVGWPDVLRVAVRLATLDRDVVPSWLAACGDIADGLARLGRPLAFVGALAAMALYVIFLAEAQRFGKLRAMANHLLATLLGAVLLGGGIALGWLAGDHPAVGLPALVCAAITLVAWRIVAARRRLPASSAATR